MTGLLTAALRDSDLQAMRRWLIDAGDGGDDPREFACDDAVLALIEDRYPVGDGEHPSGVVAFMNDRAAEDYA